MNEEFTNSDFKKHVEKNSNLTITAKSSSNTLEKFVAQNLIKKIGKAKYKKILSVEQDILGLTQKFIEDSKNNGNLQFWTHGGIISTSSEVILVGPSLKKFPPWKNEIIKILLQRQLEIYRSLQSLFTYDHKLPSINSEYAREIFLEVLPYYYGSRVGEDSDGLNPFDLLKGLERLNEFFVDYPEAKTGIEKIISMFKTNSDFDDVPKKFADNLVMIFTPATHNFDKNYDERKLVEYLQKAFAKNLSNEQIIFQLINFWNQEIINDTLLNLDYLEKSKMVSIRELYAKFTLGVLILPFLDDIDYCVKTIDLLKSGLLKEGWYGPKFENDEYIIPEIDESRKIEYLGQKENFYPYAHSFQESSKTIGRLRNTFMEFYDIPSTTKLENVLTKRISSLRKIITGSDFDKAVFAAGFAKSFKMPKQGFLINEKFSLASGLQKHGISLDDDAMWQYFQKGLDAGKKIIDNAIHTKNDLMILG